MTPKDDLGILEVLENLNSIVEASSLEELEVTEEFRFVVHKAERQMRELYWLQAGPNEITFQAIRENFRSALHYLQRFYKKMKKEAADPGQLLSEINSVMSIISQASSKLEHFDRLFKEKIPRLEEFQGLKDFYKNVVVRESPGLVSEKIFDLEKELPMSDEIPLSGSAHVLDDTELVRKDHRYELFYLKNEAGDNFYTTALARKLILACDFGSYSEGPYLDDPLIKIKDWEDKSLQILARRLYSAARKELERFYTSSREHKGVEVIILFQKAVMALFLAANPRNLIRKDSPKGCSLYFNDFLKALREILSHRDYQRYLLYETKDSAHYLKDLVDAISSLIFSLYTLAPGRSEIGHVLHDLVEEEGELATDDLAEYLKSSYERLSERLEKHPSGPVFKVYDLLMEDEKLPFDPWMLGNLPENQAELMLREKKITLIRVAAPVVQEEIDKSTVSEEFLTFLKAVSQHNQSLLCIDFQDRTSWCEHARVKTLEGVSKEALFSDAFIYVNLAKDTDFYNQLGLYRELSDANEFLRQFLIHLSEEGSGYYFPPEIRRVLFPQFIEKVVAAAYEIFFPKKKRMTLRERLDFIEIVYQLIILKIVEAVHPDFLTLTSKDALDIGATSELGLLSLIHYGRKRAWKASEVDHLRTTLFAPTLLLRERAVLPERFARLYDVLATLEAHAGYFDRLSGLFKGETLDIVIHSILPLIDKEGSSA